MTKTINPGRLKAAAEHLEWVLRQYPDNKDAQELLISLMPLINKAKFGELKYPTERIDIPGFYSFSEGLYTPYKDPSIGKAYTEFSTEARGGHTDQEKRIIKNIESLNPGEES
ncbi:hypothetical protein [Solilutibacter pythonis]|uniref:hypothetical protein n=1 Tax=Solilutibacter pythonis TaxID=2483112 RepID=UPI0011C49E18|nr:hypothetical protein [Lysobacter pythonis]